MMLCSVRPGPEAYWINGPTIVAKTHAKIGMTAHLSSIGVENLARLNSKECIEALDILALYWRPRWISPSAQYIGAEEPHNISLLFAIEQTCRGVSSE